MNAIMSRTAWAATIITMALGTMLMGSCGQRTSDSPQTSDSSTPTASGSPSASRSPSPSDSTTTTTRVLDVSDLSTGAAPNVAYATLHYSKGMPVGGVIHPVDGATVPLPAGSLNGFAPAGPRWAINTYDVAEDAEYVYVMAANGDVTEPWPASGGLAVSPEGGVVAWTSPDGTVRTLHATSGEILSMPRIPARGPYRTVGVTSEDCKEGRSTDGGCTVFVDTQETSRAYYTTSHGIVDRIPGLRQATASDARHVAGVHSVDDMEPGSCSRMVQDFDRTLWSTCDNTLFAIAPDAAHVLGLPAYLDGFGPKTLDILDMADGKPVQSWTATEDSATFFDEIWEDSSHLLVVTYQEGEWAVVRLGLDGSMEYAVAPVAGVDLERPIMLQQG